jgi:hypothetical protein
MKEQKITFSAPDIYFDLKQDHPVPIKLNIPKWYKDLKYSFEDTTIKGCIPFLETLTTGYLLKTPQSIKINFNTPNPETGQPDCFISLSRELNNEILFAHTLNLMRHGEHGHPINQLEGCPYINTNKNLPFIKIINPWKITTPPGYSCLFLSPLNNTDDRFFIIPGIVHTDTFTSEINFPIVINGDKYPTLQTVIERGTPYVQIIPFKRDNWEMEVISRDIKEGRKNRLMQSLDIIHTYKKIFWDKVSWR